MSQMLSVAAAAIAGAFAVCAQQTAPLAFEVASVKPSRPLQEQALSGRMHVGMKIDRAQVDIGALSLSDLLQTAFKVKNFQISGPDFLKSERFDILAKLPEGATEEQIPEMLQSLLAERFKLAFHRENSERSTYALVVAKGGPKLKESLPDPEPSADPPKEEKGARVMDTPQGKVSIRQDGRGGTIVNGTRTGATRVSMENGTMHMEMSKVSMPALVEALGRFVDRPIVDMTELKGNYQVALDLSMDDLRNAARAAGVAMPEPRASAAAANPGNPAENASEPAESSLSASLQRMGLKLESRKLAVETIVIDHIEKTPTEN